MKGLVDQLDRHASLGRPLSVLIIVVALFLLAWLVSRVATKIATYLVDRSERRRSAQGDVSDTGVISGIRQRETAIGLIQTTISYLAFALAFVFSLATIAGAQRLQTVIGASFLAIIIAFAAQRFLTDVIAGLLMFFEGWFRIGDTVAIDPLQVQGVVEAVSLRTLTIRSITGEAIHVPNSQVSMLRVIPRGYRDVEVEFFTTQLEPGEELVSHVAAIVPFGMTRFVQRPEVVDTEALDENLYRITAHCAVAVGREWLANDLLPSLIKERAAEGLLVHGPIITFLDENAQRSFARAIRTRSQRPRRAASPPAERKSPS
jgi:small conductance mechanosensitive channel